MSHEGIIMVEPAKPGGQTPMIQFKGTLTPDLYKRAIRTHEVTAPWFAVLFLLTGISLMAMSIRSDNDAAVAIPAAMITVGVLLLIYPSLLASRAFKTNALLRDGFAGTANESAFVAESPNGKSNIAWEKFYQAVVAPEMVLLYVSAQQFLIIPRRFFASNRDWTEFQALVRQRVPLRRRGRMLIRVALLCLVIILCAFLLWSLGSAPTP